MKAMPIYKTQRRKKQATYSLQKWNIVGADTETIEGRCWLFSTEMGVWETPTFAHLMNIIYSDAHTRKWKSGKRRGIRVPEFFFWNLKFDAQAVMRLLHEDVVLSLIGSTTAEDELGSNKVIINADTGNFLPEVPGRMVQLTYLEGKSFQISPLKWKRGKAKLGPCKWWDISQYYFKMRLNDAAHEYLKLHKIDTCFDGTVLDASRFDEAEYRDMYREDIEKYAVYDAILAGKLARLKRDDYVASGVRFIQPYSLANTAQRALMDTCEIPTLNAYTKGGKLHKIIQQAVAAYQGGWFETTGSGYYHAVTMVDLASAYPYIMYHLADYTEENCGFILGSGPTEFLQWLENRRPYSIGFCEVAILFQPGLDWYPLARMSSSGTIVTPRFVRGWFTADELKEALQWPVVDVSIGRWFYLLEGEKRPFRPFVERFYDMKMNSPKDSVEYSVAKVQINSIYGKTQQAVKGKTGKMWNPLYSSTITGATRARLAELNRLNDYSAISVATDGVIFPTQNLVRIPNRPLEACHNLGQWELEMEGEMALLMSGVYSIRNQEKTKTTYRGHASLFLNRDTDLFTFCVENQGEESLSRTVRRPYSAGEARMRGDMSLMNVFRPCDFTIRPAGDSTKRLWMGDKPRYFGDLLSQWWESTPHERVH